VAQVGLVRVACGDRDHTRSLTARKSAPGRPLRRPVSDLGSEPRGGWSGGAWVTRKHSYFCGPPFMV
jgi:hypothetical protein